MSNEVCNGCNKPLCGATVKYEGLAYHLSCAIMRIFREAKQEPL